MKFLIETDDRNIPLHDFSYQLIQAIKYQNWFYNRSEYEYKTSNEVLSKNAPELEYLPVGSLEFVWNHSSHQLNKRPINIPDELKNSKFLGREVWVSKKSEIKKFPLFVKEATVYKGENPLILYSEKDLSYLMDEKDYFVSEVIPIVSEWRGFVFGGELKDIKPYYGDVTFVPDMEKVKTMINKFDKSFSYTIDVLVNHEGTYILEIHPFVSCGLYGFSDYRILPQMFIDGYRYLQKK